MRKCTDSSRAFRTLLSANDISCKVKSMKKNTEFQATVRKQGRVDPTKGWRHIHGSWVFLTSGCMDGLNFYDGLKMYTV